MVELPSSTCTGCSSCANTCPSGCIAMEPDTEGYLRPIIDLERCTSCGLCAKRCPVLLPVDRQGHLEPKVFAAWAQDDGVRTKSSSGGLFSLLAQWVMNHGGVAYGAAFDQNFRLIHRIAETPDQLAGLRGSKYVQSDLGNVFQDIRQRLRDRQQVLFAGTPCQVAGLHRYLGNANQDTLLTADLVCHGVPSGSSFQQYLARLCKKMSIDPGSVVDFTFRKLDRWGIGSTLKTTRKTFPITGSDNIYMSLFLNGLTFRESCYTCDHAKVPRVGDLTLADFWGIGKHSPFPHDKTKGVSLVLSNTARGDAALDGIRDHCFLEERTLAEAAEVNHQLVQPFARPSRRGGVFKDFHSLSFTQMERKYFYPTLISRVKKHLRPCKIAVKRFFQKQN